VVIPTTPSYDICECFKSSSDGGGQDCRVGRLNIAGVALLIDELAKFAAEVASNFAEVACNEIPAF
jgi:hypothetical protein